MGALKISKSPLTSYTADLTEGLCLRVTKKNCVSKIRNKNSETSTVPKGQAVYQA